MSDKWKRELKIIESLGKLYPSFYYATKYKNYQKNNCEKAWWIYLLCRYQLNRRLPKMEKFMKENSRGTWYWYSEYFKITDKQCGK